MIKLYIILLIKIIICFQRIENFIQNKIELHDDYMKTIELDNNYKDCIVIILRYNILNFNFETLQKWLDHIKKNIPFKNATEYFYFEYLNMHEKSDNSNEIKFSRSSKTYLPKTIFKNSESKSDDPNQKINNKNLTDKVHKNLEHFFFYSNFDVFNSVPIFLDQIYKDLNHKPITDSLTVLVLKDSFFKNKLEDLKNFLESEKLLIKEYYITEQFEIKNGNLITKNNQDEILFEKKLIYSKEIKETKTLRSFNNKSFNTIEYSKIENCKKELLEKILNNVAISKNIKFFLGDKNQNYKFKFEFFLVSGEILSEKSIESSNTHNEYIILITKYGLAENKYMFCFSDDENEFKDFEYGEIMSYKQLDYFFDNVKLFLKKDENFNDVLNTYKSKDFFLMNDLNFPKSGKIQRIIINSNEVSFFEIFKILSTNENLIINNVVEFDYKTTLLEHTNSPSDNFLEIFKSINKKTELESSESYKLNKNFLITINYHDKETSIYLLKINILKKLIEFLSDKELKYKFKIYIECSDYEQSELDLFDFCFNNFEFVIYYSDKNHLARQTIEFYAKNEAFLSVSNIILLCENTFCIMNKNITNKKKGFADIFVLIIREFFQKYKHDNNINYNQFVNEQDEEIFEKLIIQCFTDIYMKIYEIFIYNYDKNFFLEMYCFKNDVTDSDLIVLIYNLLSQKYACEISYLQ
ncbi:hypothetical protein GVAV_002702 [Gurleya vavrai]